MMTPPLLNPPLPSRSSLRTVLLLEDHEPYRKVASLSLKHHLGAGVEVLEAADAREALHLLRALKVDVLVADVMLEEGTSKGLLEEVRPVRDQGLKILLFSNHCAESLRPLIDSELVDGFVAKEDGLRALADQVKAALANAC